MDPKYEYDSFSILINHALGTLKVNISVILSTKYYQSFKEHQSLNIYLLKQFICSVFDFELT